MEQLHSGAAVEIDVGTFTDLGSMSSTAEGPVATATRTVWLPARAPLVLPASFPPSCTVEIHATEGGRTLVAALELVSPANKDRDSKRRLFAAKCATYLSRGIGLILIDVVTSRQGNLHNEMVDLMGLEPSLRMAADASIYAIGYRPLQLAGTGRIEAWPCPLEVGKPLPTLPLSLEAEHCLPVDLEAAYLEACQRRRFEEVVG